NRTHLRFEQGQIPQTEPDAAHSQKWIPLRGRRLRFQLELVRAQIESANDDGPLPDGADHRQIRLEMIRLRGIDLLSQIKEFGAVKADALGTSLRGVRRFGWKFDISQEHDGRTVPGFRRQRLEFVQGALERLKGGAQVRVAFQRFLVRVEDEYAPVAIDNDGIASRNIGEEAPEADD